MEAAAAAAAHSLSSRSSILHRGGLSSTVPMQGLQLGKLLGAGSYGSVYSGQW
jgi:hypothetical protein